MRSGVSTIEKHKPVKSFATDTGITGIAAKLKVIIHRYNTYIMNNTVEVKSVMIKC